MTANQVFAQKVELDSDWQERASKLKEGKRAASKYMNRAVKAHKPRYMAINLGVFTESQAYRWGEQDSWNGNAKADLGVTYRVGEWTQSMDLMFRADLQTFKFDGESPLKLAMMPVVVFPDARSEFPLYFGAGLGAGIFLSQVSSESSLSLDYNLLFGARFFDVFGDAGFLFEAGLKGHFHLLSSGQFNGTYVSGGMIFNF